MQIVNFYSIIRIVGGENTNSFDRLVAGLSSEERARMLLQAGNMSKVDLNSLESETASMVSDLPLLDKLKSESSIYRFILWIRSFFTKIPAEKLYNENLLTHIERSVAQVNGNLVNYRLKFLDSIFYERLKSLQDVSNFFKPYFSFIREDIGDFYVFLGSFVAPEFTELVKQNADPFYLESGNDTSADYRAHLLRMEDELTKSMDTYSKNKIYTSIVSVHWLMCFTDAPYIHFISQFTDISNSRYTCPLINAQNDFNSLCAVLTNIEVVQPETLEAIYLFSQRRTLGKINQEKNMEAAVKEFVEKANSSFAVIKDFLKNVPMVKIGKIVNNDFDWMPGNISGVESWFSAYRNQWKKIIEMRWEEWLKEQKKQQLSFSLKSDFGLTEFPLMPDRPWTVIWSKVAFTCDLTAGFISWYTQEKYVESIKNFKVILLDGIFINPDNKNEYSDAISDFDEANTYMQDLLEKISPVGEWGKFFAQLEINRVKTMQTQNQVDALFREIQNEIREILNKFGRSARSIEAVLRGIFDEKKDGVHEPLQNFSVIGGRYNQSVKDDIQNSRLVLKKTLYYISELEQVDSFGAH